MEKKYNKMPLHYLATTTKFSSSHLGWDGGWNSKQGGANVPIYSATDGIVTYAGTYGDAGNMIRVRYDSPNKDYSIFTQYKHLSKFSVKVNDKLTRGQQLGNMGNTGSASTGAHLHFDYVVTPYQYNYTQSSTDRKKYSKDPLKYCYMFEEQVANTETLPTLTKVVNTSLIVARDTTKDQIEVIGSLNCRKGAGTNQAVLGYCDYGIYNYIETKEANGYTWYKLAEGKWIAGTKEDTKVYPKEQPTPPTPDPKDEKIKELEAELAKKNLEIKDLEAQNEALQKEIKELQEEIEELKKYSDLKVFTAQKEGYYYIYLQEGECVYLKA